MNSGLRGVFITGTDTVVGKTFVSALLVLALRQRGVRAGYLKSAATGCTDRRCEDLEFLRRYAGVEGPAGDLCPVLLSLPASPLAAARAQGVEIRLEEIREAVERAASGHDLVVVEGVGGLLVPLTPDRTVLDLIKELDLPVLVVCRPGLGTVNHSLLTLSALHRAGVAVAGFVTCGTGGEDDPTTAENPELIQAFSGAGFLGNVPFCPEPERYFSRWTRYLRAVVDRLIPGC